MEDDFHRLQRYARKVREGRVGTRKVPTVMKVRRGGGAVDRQRLSWDLGA